ncbi:MAG: carbohydrate-binding family 9-like protein [Tannerellaceae bacterium]|nr:carbohydrate-binding family 9-like protein [Tannerellaceae bacterium]
MIKSKLCLLTGLLLFCFSPRGNSRNEQVRFSPPVIFNPPEYICYRISAPITIDGKVSPEEWEEVPWTPFFVDIKGEKGEKPYLQTRAKMAYDDNGLYVAVVMEEPHIWATITEHDAAVYMDNAFEIFLNPTNDTHNYFEYQINALGTEWDLFMSKPYRDKGGVALSGWEFAGLTSAVHIEGTLNNPYDTDNFWSVEVFIPWTSLYEVMGNKQKPDAGDQIRVNMSRVQWRTEIKEGKYTKIPAKGKTSPEPDYWLWAPMRIVSIHMPEYWGIVQFSHFPAGTGEELFVRYPEEETKQILRNLYYRQQEYKAQTGHYATIASALSPQDIIPRPQIKELMLYSAPSMYEITLPDPTGKVWHIRNDGKIWTDD